MIVTLSVKNEENPGWFRYIFSDKMILEEKHFKNIKLLNISVKSRKNKIKWKKIARIFKNKKINILCNDNIIIPENFALKRFYSANFQKRLCQNAAINILKLARADPNKISISLIDKYGQYSENLDYLVRFSNKVSVITSNESLYTKKQAEIMRDYGASIVVSDKLDWLFSSCIVLAPDRIEKLLPIKKNCFIFTGEKSQFTNSVNIYYKYKVKVPYSYEKLKPDGIDSEDFLSAVFDEYNFKDMERLIPEQCLTGAEALNIYEVAARIKKQAI